MQTKKVTETMIEAMFQVYLRSLIDSTPDKWISIEMENLVRDGFYHGVLAVLEKEVIDSLVKAHAAGGRIQ